MTADYTLSTCFCVDVHFSILPLLCCVQKVAICVSAHSWIIFFQSLGRSLQKHQNPIKLKSRPFRPMKSKNPPCQGKETMWRRYQIQDTLTECLREEIKCYRQLPRVVFVVWRGNCWMHHCTQLNGIFNLTKGFERKKARSSEAK